MKNQFRFQILVMASLSIFGLFAHANPTDAPAVTEEEFADWMSASVETPESTKILQERALAVPMQLLKDRQSRLGSFDLDKLVADIKTVHWRVTLMPIGAGAHGTRASGTYSVKLKTVIISQDEWNKLGEAMHTNFAFHEVLGALGYRDENYQLSSAFFVFTSLAAARELQANGSTEVPSEDIQKLFKTLPGVQAILEDNRILNGVTKTNKTPKFKLKGQPQGWGGTIKGKSGGVTGIGGGGDEHELAIKTGLATLAPAMWGVRDHLGLELNKFMTIILTADVQRIDTPALNGRQLVELTKIEFKNGSLHIQIPTTDVYLNPERYPVAADYMAYLVDESMFAVSGKRPPE